MTETERESYEIKRLSEHPEIIEVRKTFYII